MSTSFFVNNGGSTAARDTIEGQVAAATTAKEDAVKVTNTAYNAQYTLSDGTTGYSANHYSQNSASISATVNTNMLETGNFRSEALEHRNRSEGFKDEAQSFRNDAESYKNQAEAATSNLVNLVGNESITGNKTFTGDIIASGGIKLGGTAAANELEDYETGTWTPYLARWTGGNISATYTTQNGRYTKIGRMVTLSFDINTSAIHGQGSSIAYIAGAPFNNSSSVNYQFAGTFGIRTSIPQATIATSCIKHNQNSSIMIRQNNDFDENYDDAFIAGIIRGSITYEHG